MGDRGHWPRQTPFAASSPLGLGAYFRVRRVADIGACRPSVLAMPCICGISEMGNPVTPITPAGVFLAMAHAEDPRSVKIIQQFKQVTLGHLK